jgi:hypothetical protein
MKITESELKAFVDVLKKWKCAKCGTHIQSWNVEPAKCVKEGCESREFVPANNVSTVPVTTGIETELIYDNLHTIDDAVEHETGIEEQNRDLEKLEKARR